MKKTLLLISAILTVAVGTAWAAESTDTVKVIYNGATATVSIPASLANIVTCSSSTSSHVVLTQGNTSTELVYSLSGSSTDGAFTMTGSYKMTLNLNGVTLTNTEGAPVDIQNGKRIKIKMAEGTVNTLTDSRNGAQKGCLVIKGHSEFRGKGTLNINGNSAHGIKSGEYISVKNCTINVNKAAKDGMNCNEYFLLESGNINIKNTGDDGIQVDVDTDMTQTTATTDHEDENSGNFYAVASESAGTAGTLAIDNYEGKAIKAGGSITLGSGFVYDFDTTDIKENTTANVEDVQAKKTDNAVFYSIDGRRLHKSAQMKKGIYVLKSNGHSRTFFVK